VRTGITERINDYEGGTLTRAGEDKALRKDAAVAHPAQHCPLDSKMIKRYGQISHLPMQDVVPAA